MITNFENITYKLTDEEMKHLPTIIAMLKQSYGRDKAVSCTHIQDKVNISQARIRIIINYIRRNGLVPDLCASSKGYYVARTQQEFHKYVQSLTDRINSIQSVLDAINNNHSPQYELI
jgi:hypothetical protein